MWHILPSWPWHRCGTTQYTRHSCTSVTSGSCITICNADAATPWSVVCATTPTPTTRAKTSTLLTGASVGWAPVTCLLCARTLRRHKAQEANSVNGAISANSVNGAISANSDNDNNSTISDNSACCPEGRHRTQWARRSPIDLTITNSYVEVR